MFVPHVQFNFEDNWAMDYLFLKLKHFLTLGKIDFKHAIATQFEDFGPLFLNFQ